MVQLGVHDTLAAVHAVVACVATLGTLPAALLIGRYCRANPHWLRAHMMLNIATTLLIVLAFGLGMGAVASQDAGTQFNGPDSVLAVVLTETALGMYDEWAQMSVAETTTPESVQIIFWIILLFEVSAYTLHAGNEFMRWIEVRLEGPTERRASSRDLSTILLGASQLHTRKPRAVPEPSDVLLRTPPELVLKIFDLSHNPSLTHPLSKSLLPYAITMRQQILVLSSESRIATFLSQIRSNNKSQNLLIKQLHLHLPDLEACESEFRHNVRKLLDAFPSLSFIRIVIATHGECSVLGLLRNRLVTKGIDRCLEEIEVGLVHETYEREKRIRKAAPELEEAGREAGVVVTFT
ncbi:hypothetical protein RQP46_008183 [Phenoliferia psychrophenolica]